MNEYSVTIKFTNTTNGKEETRYITVQATSLEGAVNTVNSAYAGFNILSTMATFVRHIKERNED